MDQQWSLNAYDGNTQFHNYYKPMELTRLEPTRKIKLQRNHDRTPDIGMRIRVTMRHEEGHGAKEYIGEYYGHGKSKTVFILNGASGDPYDGKILKVTAEPDIEPDVFTKMTERSPGTTSRIL